jgi:DNA polymerase-1
MHNILAIDIETTGLGWDAKVLIAAWSSSDGQSGYFNLGFADMFTQPDPVPYVYSQLTEMIRQHELVAMHNATFDVPYLVRDGLINIDHLAGKLLDTQLLARMTDRHDDGISLMAVCRKYGINTTESDSKWKYMKSQRAHLDRLSADAVGKYAVMDTTATLQLATLLLHKVEEQYGVERAAFEGNYVLEISKMRLRGMPLNLERIRELIAAKTARKTEIVKELMAVRTASRPIKSGNDNKNIASWLRSHNVHPPLTDSGNPVLDEKYLESVRSTNGAVDYVVGLILEYRELDKQLSTWLQGFLDHNFGDGKVHPLFGAAGTYTYRLNCTQPNAQAVERTMDLFSAPPGWKLVEADYKAMELRLSAMYAGEHKFAEIFYKGEDFHWSTARMLFGENATKEHRRYAKSCNFGIIYGGGANSIASSTGVDIDHAKEIVTQYKRTFSAIAKASKQAEQVWKDRGYLVLAHGARLYARTEELDVRAYKAFNNLVQASVAQIAKMALLAVASQMPHAQPIAQIHDSLYVLVPEDTATEDAEKISELMTDACPPWLEDRLEPKIRLEVEAKIK